MNGLEDFKNHCHAAPWLMYQSSGVASATALALRSETAILQRLQELFLKASLDTHFLQSLPSQNLQLNLGFSVEDIDMSLGKQRLQVFTAKICATWAIRLHCAKQFLHRSSNEMHVLHFSTQCKWKKGLESIIRSSFPPLIRMGKTAMRAMCTCTCRSKG